VLLLFILSAVTVLAPAKVDIQGEIVASHFVDAPATLQLFSGKNLVQTVTSDEHGHFRFTKIEAGSYTMHVECDGYYAQDIPVQVANSTSHVSVMLKPAPDNPSLTAAFDPFRDLDIPAKARKEFDLGVRPQKDGKCGMRIEHLRKALSLFPRYGEAFTEIARCYVQMNDMAGAEAAFKSAIRYTTGIYPTINLANLLINENRLDDAQALITPLFKKNPTEGEPYASMARINYARGQLRETEAAVIAAHERGHQSPDIHLILAKIYEDRGMRGALATQLLNYLDEAPHGAAADQVRKKLQDLQDR
jgi:tetratricopeptide (TPR) repeat protein